MVLFADKHFLLESGGEIPGHVILRPVRPVNHLGELPAEALAKLGPLLARGMAVIQRVMDPERIYVARFGEEVEAIHFHLFPRTREMAELYGALHPGLPPASGAQMFDWARRPEIMAQLRFSLTPEEALAQMRGQF